jgi:hypothetical protein
MSAESYTKQTTAIKCIVLPARSAMYVSLRLTGTFMECKGTKSWPNHFSTVVINRLSPPIMICEFGVMVGLAPLTKRVRPKLCERSTQLSEGRAFSLACASKMHNTY